MNLRRSRSVRLVSPNSQFIEVEIGGRSQMTPQALNTVYCCVAKGNKVVYSYNSAGQELEILAAQCLENSPAFHSWYFHSVGMRTFGFLMVDGYTYFAIVDPSLGNLAVLRFLKSIKEAFRRSPRNDFQDELIAVIKHLVASLEYAPESPLLAGENSEGNDVSPSTKQPLLGNGRHSEKKRTKERGASENDDGAAGDPSDEIVRIDMASEPRAVMPLQTSLSSNRMRTPQGAVRKMWWKHVKIIVFVDIILCLILFVVWLVVCNGLSCVGK